MWTIIILFTEQSLFYIRRVSAAALQHQHVCLTQGIKAVVKYAAALISGPLWNKKLLHTTGQTSNNWDKLTSAGDALSSVSKTVQSMCAQTAGAQVMQTF